VGDALADAAEGAQAAGAARADHEQVGPRCGSVTTRWGWMRFRASSGTTASSRVATTTVRRDAGSSQSAAATDSACRLDSEPSTPTTTREGKASGSNGGRASSTEAGASWRSIVATLPRAAPVSRRPPWAPIAMSVAPALSASSRSSS